MMNAKNFLRPAGRRTFRVLASSALAVIMLLHLVAPAVAGGDGGGNVWITWDRTEQIPLIAPIVGWELKDGTDLGCAGTVRVTFHSGAVRTLPGTAFGSDACKEGGPDPCVTWSDVAASCVVDNLFCCVTFQVVRTADVNLAELLIGCLTLTWIHTDLDGDGAEDTRTGTWTFDVCN